MTVSIITPAAGGHVRPEHPKDQPEAPDDLLPALQRVEVPLRHQRGADSQLDEEPARLRREPERLHRDGTDEENAEPHSQNEGSPICVAISQRRET